MASAEVEAATQRAGGNPLLALVASESTATEADGDPVAERFLALPADQLEVIGVAGLVGRTIDVALVERADRERPRRISPSASMRRCAPACSRRSGSTLAFVHDLVREAAVTTLPAHRRTVLHAAAATALLRRRDTLAAIRHVLDGFGAFEPDDAVEAVARGCEQLAQRLAFEEMLAVATRLGEVVAADHRCRPRHEAAALLTVSWAYQLLGDVPRQQETALAAGRRARADGAYVLLAEAALSRAGSGPAGDADPETAELLDSALALAPTDDLAQRSRLMGMRAYYLLNYEGQRRRGTEGVPRGARRRPPGRRSRGPSPTPCPAGCSCCSPGATSSSRWRRPRSCAASSLSSRRPEPATSGRDCSAISACSGCSWPTAAGSRPATTRSARWGPCRTAGSCPPSPRCGMAWSPCSTVTSSSPEQPRRGHRRSER